MADKKFSELITAATVTDSGILAMSQDLNGSLASQKTTVGAIGTHIAKEMNFTADLQTTSKNIIGAINEAATSGGDTVTVTNTITPTTTTKKVADVNINSVANSIYADDAEKVLRQAFSDHTETGNPISFDAYLGLEVAKSCEVTFSPIQSGSGDPSPTNIRPISGRDSVVLYQAGVNLANTTIYKQGYVLGSNGSETVSANYCITDKCIVTAGKSYVLRWKENSGTVSDNVVRIGWYKSNGDFISRTAPTNTSPYITAPANAAYCKLSYNNNQETDNYKWDIMLNEGETALDYVPYNGETHTATFPDTEYGGSYEFVSGKEKSEYCMADIGDITFGRHTTGNFFGTLSDAPSTTAEALCSKYKYMGVISSIADLTTDKAFALQPANNRIVVRDTTYTSADEFNASTSGVQLCYELATPTEITLTAEQIELLKGQNVLWTDGDNIALTYTADIKTWVQNQLAQLS